MRALFAIETPERSWSSAEVAVWAGNWAQWLMRQGLRPQQVLGLVAQPTPAYLTALLGCWEAGGIVLPLNPRLPESQLEQALTQAGARWSLGGPAGPRRLDWPERTALSAPAFAPAATLSLNPDRPLSLILTSGSSGQPKLALHHYGHHLASATAFLEVFPLAPADRWLLALPLFHIGGLAILIRCAQVGATVVMPDGRELAAALTALRPTHLSLVATQLQRLLEVPAAVTVLQTAKLILLGGSAIPGSLLARAHALGLPIHTSYGATETSSLVSCTPAGADFETLQTSGRLLPYHQLRIAADGEIQLNGPAIFAGYFSSQAAFASLCEDAAQPPSLCPPSSVFAHPHTLTSLRSEDRSGGQPWLRTRDRGYVDAQGRLRVLGRLDHLFISGGENIQPEEIEKALLSLADIQQAVVVPIPSAEYGARPLAFVEATSWQPANWRDRLRKLLPAYKLPDRFLPWPEGQIGLKPSRADLVARAGQQFPDGI